MIIPPEMLWSYKTPTTLPINRNRQRSADKLGRTLLLKHNGRVTFTTDAIYDKASSPFPFVCLVCNHNWSATPAAVLTRTGCPECAKKTQTEKTKGQRRKFSSKAEQEFCKRCSEAGLNSVEIGKLVRRNSNTIRQWIDPVQKQRVIERSRLYRLNNPERVAKTLKEWAQSDHGRLTRYTHECSRDAIKYGATFDVLIDGRWEPVDMYQYLRQDRGSYAYFKFEGIDEKIRDLKSEAIRLQEETGVEYHIDHKVPLSRGGIHHPANLHLLPATENLSKNNNLVKEHSESFAKEIFNIR